MFNFHFLVLRSYIGTHKTTINHFHFQNIFTTAKLVFINKKFRIYLDIIIFLFTLIHFYSQLLNKLGPLKRANLEK